MSKIMQREVLLSKMTWPEVRERLKVTNIAMVPIGSIEQHGPALPLDTDIHNAYTVAKKAAERVAEDVKPVMTPPISFGFSDHHMDFPGTISIREDVLANFIIDVCKSLVHHGFKKIVIINGHGGNHAAIHMAVYTLKKETKAFIVYADLFNFAADVVRQLAEPPSYHADDVETSVAMALGQHVRKVKLVKEIARTPIPKYIKIDFSAPPPTVKIPVYLKEFTKTGVIGDPTKASREKGERIVEATVERLAEFLRQLKRIEI